MRKLLVLLFLFVIHQAVAQVSTITYEGNDRSYLVHLPTGYTGDEELPLVIVMHGGGGSASSMEYFSQLSIKADDKHFIAVYPEGVKDGLLKISAWNAGDCCGFPAKNNIDDVGFIDTMLTILIDKYAIDRYKVYATGMSNGGFMSYRLACELSDRIAAIAPVECTMTMDICKPTRAIPILHIHSYIDNNIPYLGGIGSGVSKHYNPPLDSVLSYWASNNNCDITHDTMSHNDEYTLVNWRDCNCNSEIILYITQDGGHAWPGYNGSSHINAADLIWSFFEQHTLDCNTDAVTDTPFNNSNIEIYPNPARDQLIINPTIYYKEIIVWLYDMKGQLIIKKINDLSIDISLLVVGNYNIVISVDGKLYRNQMIKLGY